MIDVAYLTLKDIQARWSCGKTFVYGALEEMQAEGYLRRLWVGKRQRIAIDSVERYELMHARRSGQRDRADIAAARTRTRQRHRNQLVPPTESSAGDLLKEWRSLKNRRTLVGSSVTHPSRETTTPH